MTEQSLKNKTIQRNSNLELYRIIVMLLIVAHHYVVNSGVLEVANESPTSFRSIYYYLLQAKVDFSVSMMSVLFVERRFFGRRALIVVSSSVAR